MITKRNLLNKLKPLISLQAPPTPYLLNKLSGYALAFEPTVHHGCITFLLLWIISKRAGPPGIPVDGSWEIKKLNKPFSIYCLLWK
jgi:hypothetical protein